jgi:hypothetical protein
MKFDTVHDALEWLTSVGGTITPMENGRIQARVGEKSAVHTGGGDEELAIRNLLGALHAKVGDGAG